METSAKSQDPTPEPEPAPETFKTYYSRAVEASRWQGHDEAIANFAQAAINASTPSMRAMTMLQMANEVALASNSNPGLIPLALEAIHDVVEIINNNAPAQEMKDNLVRTCININRHLTALENEDAETFYQIASAHAPERRIAESTSEPSQPDTAMRKHSSRQSAVDDLETEQLKAEQKAKQHEIEANQLRQEASRAPNIQTRAELTLAAARAWALAADANPLKLERLSSALEAIRTVNNIIQENSTLQQMKGALANACMEIAEPLIARDAKDFYTIACQNTPEKSAECNRLLRGKVMAVFLATSGATTEAEFTNPPRQLLDEGQLKAIRPVDPAAYSATRHQDEAGAVESGQPSQSRTQHVQEPIITEQPGIKPSPSVQPPAEQEPSTVVASSAERPGLWTRLKSCCPLGTSAEGDTYITSPTGRNGANQR